MTSKNRSKSLLKAGFDINPNQLSTNFNKKNQIGFKLKLMENLRNSKKIIDKYEDGLDDSFKQDETVVKRRKEKIMDYMENLRIRNNSLNYLDSNNIEDSTIYDEVNEISSNNIRNLNSKNEKSYSTKSLSNNFNFKENEENKIDKQKNPSFPLLNKKNSTGNLNNIKIKNNLSKTSIKPSSTNKLSQYNTINQSSNMNKQEKEGNQQYNKIINDFDSLMENATDFQLMVNQQYCLDDETKILDTWIDYENSLSENRVFKHHLIKLLYLFKKFYTEEKQIFLNETANKSFYKLIKLMISVIVAILFSINYIGIDIPIKLNLKKLTSSISKPLFQIYEIFGIKNLCKNINYDLSEKINKFTAKSYKLEKHQIKNPNLLVYIYKEIDNAGLSLKQFAK